MSVILTALRIGGNNKPVFDCVFQVFSELETQIIRKKFGDSQTFFENLTAFKAEENKQSLSEPLPPNVDTVKQRDFILQQLEVKFELLSLTI